MSREELAALEQRWRATGAVADEARLLRWRVYYRDLAEEALDLAAHLGHPAAREALGKDAPPNGSRQLIIVWLERIFQPWKRRNVLPDRWSLPASGRSTAEPPAPVRPAALDTDALLLPLSFACGRLLVPYLRSVRFDGFADLDGCVVESMSSKLSRFLDAVERETLQTEHAKGLHRLFHQTRPADDPKSRALVGALESLRALATIVAWRTRNRSHLRPMKPVLRLVIHAAAHHGDAAVRAAIRDALVPLVLRGAGNVAAS